MRVAAVDERREQHDRVGAPASAAAVARPSTAAGVPDGDADDDRDAPVGGARRWSR